MFVVRCRLSVAKRIIQPTEQDIHDNLLPLKLIPSLQGRGVCGDDIHARSQRGIFGHICINIQRTTNNNQRTL